jgi:hypothetical protein
MEMGNRVYRLRYRKRKGEIFENMLRVKEKERRSSIVYRSKERENYGLIYERERRKTPCRLPKPEPKAEYQCRALFLSMGAGEAGGGRRDRWGRPATGLMPESTGIED